MKKFKKPSLINKTAICLILFVPFYLKGYAQNEKCLALAQEMIQEVKGKIMSKYVSLEDETFYVVKAEVPSSCTFENIRAACDSVNKDAKVISDWKLNYDKNYEKRFKVNGKMVLVTFYPADKILYFEIPKD
jgi:hypothetical protein